MYNQTEKNHSAHTNILLTEEHRKRNIVPK